MPIATPRLRSPSAFLFGLLVPLALTTSPGCATPKAAEPPPATASAENPSSAPSTPPTTPGPPGTIARRDLIRVLDRGPQNFLASIQEDPLVENGHFKGWIFRGWRDPRFATTDVLPGDLIARINGQPVERPEQFMEVWNALRTAPALVIELVREGQARQVKYTIRDD